MKEVSEKWSLLSVFICMTGVETLLCYLELHPQRFVEQLHPTLSVCKVSCYDGPRQLQRITKMYELLSFEATLIWICGSNLISYLLTFLFSFSFLNLTHSCPPVAVVLARRRMAGEHVEACDQLEFDVVEVADTMGWQLPLVKRGLRQLQWSTGKGVCVRVCAWMKVIFSVCLMLNQSNLGVWLVSECWAVYVIEQVII